MTKTDEEYTAISDEAAAAVEPQDSVVPGRDQQIPVGYLDHAGNRDWFLFAITPFDLERPVPEPLGVGIDGIQAGILLVAVHTDVA